MPSRKEFALRDVRRTFTPEQIESMMSSADAQMLEATAALIAARNALSLARFGRLADWSPEPLTGKKAGRRGGGAD